jgi:hypothetical protein
MKLPVLICCCLVIGVSLADTKRAMWVWKDANGVTQYSDKPVPGARRIEVTTMTPEPAPPGQPAPVTPTAPSPSAKPSTVEYTLLEIWSPAQDETFFGTDSQVDVKVRVEPDLSPDHYLRVYLDGRMLEGPDVNSTEHSFGNLDRGAHSLVAQILDGQGNVLIRSEPRVFHVRQETVIGPRNVGPSLRPKPTPQPAGKKTGAPKAVG